MRARAIPVLPLLLLLLLSIPLRAQPAMRVRTPRLAIAHLAGDCYVYTTWMPISDKPFSANGMYVVTDSGVVMIDTPWDVAQTAPLLDSIRARHGKPVIACIVTHVHEDRTGGLDILKARGIRTYSSKRTWLIEPDTSQGERRAEFYFEKDTTFHFGRHTLRTYFPGEGHTSDNIVIWCAPERVLFGGCLVKSTDAADLGYTGAANIAAWPASIRNVKRTFPQPAYIIPGHQGWTSRASLDHTLKLLAKQGKQ